MRIRFRRLLLWLGACLGVGLLFLAVAALWPLTTVPVPPLPPAADQGTAEALQREVEVEEAGKPLAEVCRSRVWSHGRPTPRVYVIYHGLTNCPQQWEALGEILFATGANVVVLRLPEHGFSDRLNPPLGRLTASALVANGALALDLGRGLGERTTLIGLSLGGAMAAWMAQNRADVDQVVLMSPFLGLPGLPVWLNPGVARILQGLPNADLWWNPKLREKNPGPPYAYPRFATRAIAASLQLGQLSLQAAASSAPATRRALFITSGADRAVSAAAIRLLADRWAAAPGTRVDRLVFPAAEGVPHDFIDPSQPDEQTARVYPLIIQAILEQQDAAAGEAERRE